MRIKILLFLFLFATVKGFSQEPVSPVKASKFRIGVNASFEKVSRRQGWHNAIEESAMEAWNIKHAEAAAGFSADIRLGYAIGRRTDLELGVGYKQRQFAWDYSKMRFRHSHSLIRPIGYDEPGGLTSRQLQYLDIPLRLSHSVGNGHLRWISSIGISTNILVFESDPPPAVLLNQPALFMWKPRKLNISPTISTGLAFFLSDRSDLRLEPTFMYGIIPLTNNSVQTYLWSAGVNFGYYRRF